MSIYNTELGLLGNISNMKELGELKGEALVEKQDLVLNVVNGSLCCAHLFGFKKKSIVAAKVAKKLNDAVENFVKGEMNEKRLASVKAETLAALEGLHEEDGKLRIMELQYRCTTVRLQAMT
eukprot:3387369-Lingulodinium_polyedra.AAC.1